MLGLVEILKEWERYHDVRYLLRVLAKLFKEYRLKCKQEIFADQQIIPSNCDNLISVMLDLSGYEGTHKMRKPCVVINVGSSLNHVMLMVLTYCIKWGNRNYRKMLAL